MVTENNIYFIDTTFIFKNIHNSFFATPLLINNEKDNTFLFGFFRSFFRIRELLGIFNVVVAIGKEAYFYTSKENIQNVITLLHELNIPYISEADEYILNIAFALQSSSTYFITQNINFLQLATGNKIVVLFSDQKNYTCIIENDIKHKIGVDKKHIASYVAMTQGQKKSVFTKRQTIRLIELYGDLNKIYENLTKISSTEITQKLISNKDKLLAIYQSSKFSKSSKIQTLRQQGGILDLATVCNEEILRDYGFYSLVRMLKSPTSINLKITKNKVDLNNYEAVIDRKQLNILVSLVIDADICAIDTESDDKDPHQATLLGVSFSVSYGMAFFVPLTEPDLKNISRKDVMQALKKIFKSNTAFIGHNIKYDYLLLRRNSIEIKIIHFDTMLAVYECYSDWDFFNLSYLAKKLLGEKIKSYRDIVKNDQTFLDLPLKVIVQHGCQDVDITLRLYHVLKQEINNKKLTCQYERTLLILKKLAEFEYKGIPVKLEKLENIRKLQLNEILEIKTLVYDKVVNKFDLDSSKDLGILLNEKLNLKSFVGSKKITLSLLEQLAINRPIVQLIVKYKRSRKSLMLIESILKSLQDSRIHPVFNQISSSYGQLYSKKPNIFEYNGVYNLAECFDKFLVPYFRNKSRSIDIIEEITKDQNLRKDRCSNWIELYELQPLFKGIEIDEFLLSVVSGLSDFKLSKKFLVDRLTISIIRHDIVRRYSNLFDWIDNFCENTAKQGYAEIKSKRKYIEGIRSSNIKKRIDALNLAVKWVINY